MRLSLVANVLMGTLTGDCEFNSFAIDSRDVRPGNIFVCLKGARVDGHDYICQAQENGAVGFLCEHPVDTALPCLIVPSALEGLQQFSAWYRSSLDIRIVAVTGSVGKTTTKECIACVLSQSYRTHKTQGNKNSETGLPLTLLGIREDDQAAVVEMGMSALGEIKVLSDLACPDIAVITNIGVSHIENLGSQENILRAKLEILSSLKQNGILILNYDDPYLSKAYDELNGKISQRIIRYGISNPVCDIFAQEVAMEDGNLRFLVQTPDEEFTILMPCEGVHNVYNALAAVAVGLCMNVSSDGIREGLRRFQNVPLRQQSYERCGFQFIEDCYNASPSSMQAAIDVLRLRNCRKIAVFGDMLELGKYSADLHKQVGRMLKDIDALITFGTYRDCYVEGAVCAGLSRDVCYPCADIESAAETLLRVAHPGDCILVKASRGVQAENVLKRFFELKDGGTR